MIPEQDIRDIIFAGIREKKYIAQISAQTEGILSGIEWLKKACEKSGAPFEEMQEKRGEGQTWRRSSP